MEYIIPRGMQAVMGIPVGRLNDLLARVVALELNSGFRKLTTPSDVDDSNLVFSFIDASSVPTAPTYLVINGIWYDNNATGQYTWTGTIPITLNQPVGSGGTIFGFK